MWPLPQHETATSDVAPLTLLGLLIDWRRGWFAGPMLPRLLGVHLWDASAPFIGRHRQSVWKALRRSPARS
jgi:hypothetical protein